MEGLNHSQFLLSCLSFKHLTSTQSTCITQLPLLRRKWLRVWLYQDIYYPRGSSLQTRESPYCYQARFNLKGTIKGHIVDHIIQHGKYYVDMNPVTNYSLWYIYSITLFTMVHETRICIHDSCQCCNNGLIYESFTLYDIGSPIFMIYVSFIISHDVCILLSDQNGHLRCSNQYFLPKSSRKQYCCCFK